jgi:hypothetical protein
MEIKLTSYILVFNGVSCQLHALSTLLSWSKHPVIIRNGDFVVLRSDSGHGSKEKKIPSPPGIELQPSNLYTITFTD